MSSKPGAIPGAATFAVAGASGISAWLLIHPFDVIKVRMQLMGETKAVGGPVGPVAAAREIVRVQGARFVYTVRSQQSNCYPVVTLAKACTFSQFSIM
jgi:hypothetical protein